MIKKLNKILVVVIPVSNEEDNIFDFVNDILKKLSFLTKTYLILSFDQTNKDKSLDIAKSLAKKNGNIKIVNKPTSCPVEAYLNGYYEAIQIKCDYIVELNAGYRHQPDDLKKLYNGLNQNIDCIFGSRFIEGANCFSNNFFRYFLSKQGSIFSNLLLGTKLTDMTSGFICIKKNIIKNILENTIILSRFHFFQTELKYYLRDFSYVEIPITYNTNGKNLPFNVIFESLYNLFQLFMKRIKPE